jgi:predicted chitinase
MLIEWVMVMKSGEPSKFIGRGALQLTGKNNYKLFSDFIGEDCVKNPDLVATKYFFKVLSSFLILISYGPYAKQ